MANILIIEDAENLATVLQQELKKNGHQAYHCNSGEEGLSFLQHHAINLVILDWMLPGIDGLAVLREVQKTCEIPVLMLTARADELDKVIGLELGAEDYLTKPFSMRELLARVNVILRRSNRATTKHESNIHQSKITWKTLVLDTNQHQVWVAEINTNLSPTEFDLLELFLQNPGRVFNRSFLMESVWHEQYIPGDRSIDNAILRLRKKISPLGDAIESVWGIGYRFNIGQ
ncbi:MAG: response regulator transcription factor [Anaerolineaceae bacterium]|nr:response regulator transcription factor [Anaerolineaceae bacterium]